METAGPSRPRMDQYPPYVVHFDDSSSEDEENVTVGETCDSFPTCFVEILPPYPRENVVEGNVIISDEDERRKASEETGVDNAIQEEQPREHRTVREVTLVQPDGGIRPWLSVLACCALLFLSSGMGKSFGDIKRAITAEFDCSHNIAVMIPGIFSAGTLFWAPVTAAMIRNFGARLMLAVGCVLCMLGFIVSGSADSGEYLVMSLGLLVATGFSIVANYTVFVIGKLFKERKAWALGIALSGGCIGHELLPRIFDLALRTFGPRGVFGFLAVASAIWIMICLYVVGDPERQMVSQVTTVPAPAELVVPAPEAKWFDFIRDELGLSLFADYRLWLIATSAVFFGLGSPAIGGAMTAFSGNSGYDYGEIFCLVSSVGVRLSFGVFSARSRFDRTAEYTVAIVGATAMFAGLIVLPSHMRIASYVFGALFSGGWAVLIPAVLGFTLGTANIGKAFALVKFCRGLVNACWLIPKSEIRGLLGLEGTIWLDFAFCVVASALAMLLYHMEKKKPESKSPGPEKNSEDALIGIFFLYSL